jgi:hypothetical protein
VFFRCHSLPAANYFLSTPIPILDANDRLLAILAGQPNDPKWRIEVHEPFLEALLKARSECAFTEEECLHKRGVHATLPGGISFGGGQRVLGNLQMSSKREAVFKCLLREKFVRRLAGFMSSAFPSLSKSRLI